MREEPRSSPQPAWSRSFLRSRVCLWTAPSAVAQGLWRDTCSSSHLGFLKHLGKAKVFKSEDSRPGFTIHNARPLRTKRKLHRGFLSLPFTFSAEPLFNGIAKRISTCALPLHR